MSPIRFELPPGAVRLHENDANMDADGGRVVLVADAPALGEMVEAPHFIAAVTVVINYRKDDKMLEWPVTREERAGRRFTLVIEEVTEEEALAARERSRR